MASSPRTEAQVLLLRVQFTLSPSQSPHPIPESLIRGLFRMLERTGQFVVGGEFLCPCGQDAGEDRTVCGRGCVPMSMQKV